MTDPKPAEAKTCVHTWSDRDWRGRRMDDGVLCAKCGRLSHWYRIVREQAERIAELELRISQALGELRPSHGVPSVAAACAALEKKP